MTRGYWTDKQYQDLMCYVAQGLDRSEIAKIMGRSIDSIHSKVRDGHGENRVGKSQSPLHEAEDARIEVPAHVLEDRARRESLSPRDYTSAFNGDPLPGMSALDQRRA